MRHPRTARGLWIAAIITTIVACRYWDAIWGKR
jgi:hypothetical protein